MEDKSQGKGGRATSAGRLCMARSRAMRRSLQGRENDDPLVESVLARCCWRRVLV